MKLKVLSWNIWVNSYYNHVRDFLIKSNADIIGLQEVSGNDSTRNTVKLLTDLGFSNIFAPQPRPWAKNNREDGPAIFTKHKIISSKKYVLSKEYGVGVVQADIKINDKPIHVFSTHLSHDHQSASTIQVDQVNKLLKLIPKTNSILMGDFNALPSSKTIKLVSNTFLNTDQGNKPTWSVYPQGCEVCNPQKVDIRLDYIFTSNNIKTLSFKVEQSKGSDHLPISTTLEIH